jgi:hypothetical protein
MIVKVFPSGQFRLRANPSLCLSIATSKMTLQTCDAAQAAQQWTIETTLSDGSFVCGPVTSAVNKQVMDIYYSGEDVDTGIAVYGWGATPNQVFNYDATTGLIRATQLGVCAGACSYF